ncbi:MAG: ribosome biogenesis GTPase YqeH [Coprobacillus sp.]
MNKETKCFGCGAVIQNENEKHIGYVPKSAMDNETILCQRCFKLKNYHQIQETTLTKDDFLSILQDIGEKDCLVVYMVDLFDFNGSLIHGLMRHISNNDVLVLANKRDILPKSVKEVKLEHWVRRQLKEEGIKPVDVMITSGLKNMNLDGIYDAIMDYRKGRDVYVVGITNVGKSTFINSLLRHYANISDKNLITVSEYPGTTLNLIEIPLDNESFLFDTPGIINENQMTHLLNHQDIIKVIPQTELRPMVFQLDKQQTLYFGGLARLDYVEGEKASFIAYFSKNLKIHRTKLINADELYNRHQALQYEIEGIQTIDEMKTYDFKLYEGKCDIVISGLGFITINSNGGRVQVKVPPQISVIIRESII